MRSLGDTSTGKKTVVERLLPQNSPSRAIVAVRNIARQRRRAASTMIGVVLALVMIVSAFVMNDSINSIFARQYQEVDQRDLVVALNEPVTPKALNKFASISGVTRSEPYGQTPPLLRSGSSFIGQQLQAFEPATLAHAFDQAPVGPGIVLGSAARDELGLGLGDTLMATLPAFGQEQQLTVIGFADEPIRGYSYVDVGQWESLTGTPPTEIVLTLTDDGAHRSVRDEVAAVEEVLSVNDQIAIAIQTKSLLAATKFFVVARPYRRTGSGGVGFDARSPLKTWLSSPSALCLVSFWVGFSEECFSPSSRPLSLPSPPRLTPAPPRLTPGPSFKVVPSSQYWR